MNETERLKYELKAARRALAEARAATVPKTDGNAVYYFDDFVIDELRYFVNAASPRVCGMLVALCGSAGDYKYLIASSNVDLTAEIKKINAALSGKGGGRQGSAQGSFSASLDEIRKYFAVKT